MSALVDARAKIAKPKRKRANPAQERKSVAEVLIGLARQNAELFHDAGNVGFSCIGSKTFKVKSRAFRIWLSGLYHHATDGKAANNEAVAVALNTLEAHAIHES